MCARHTREPPRIVSDSAARRVEAPHKIARLLAAGPPASIVPYALAAAKMIGWVRAPIPGEKPWIYRRIRELPEYGRLTGRVGTANLEDSLKFKPDLIIDSGRVGPIYVSLADDVQEETKIPYLLLDGRFDKTAEVCRVLESIPDAKDRAEQLVGYADETLNGLLPYAPGGGARLATIPEDQRLSVYRRGADGLETGVVGSINMEVLEHVGAINVALYFSSINCLILRSSQSATRVDAWPKTANACAPTAMPQPSNGHCTHQGESAQYLRARLSTNSPTITTTNTNKWM
jgi:iron complex transport system substrate-binding protein